MRKGIMPAKSGVVHSGVGPHMTLPPQGKLRKSGAGARECIPDERVLKETQLRFPPFILPMPRFVSSEVVTSLWLRWMLELTLSGLVKDREWFLSQRVIKEFVNASLSCFARPADIACPSLDAQISPYDVPNPSRSFLDSLC